MELSALVGSRIAELRKAHGYTRSAYAEHIGIPHTTLRNYELGVREAGHSFLLTVARDFNVSTDYLLGLSELPQSSVSPTLTQDEQTLLTQYRALSSQGQTYIRQTMQMAVQSYKKLDSLSSMA